MSDETARTLGAIADAGEVHLGRGEIISAKDIAASPGEYPIYSSSARGSGEFGRYGKYMFDEELITWSVDGGGRSFYRPRHRFSVTNVSGFLRILDLQKWNYRFLHAAMERQHARITFDYQMKAHPSVIRNLYRFTCPPLPEQRRIAEILDTLDEAIRKTEQVIAKLQQMKQGLLHDLLTRGIDENGELRDPERHPEQFKDSPLGRIPREWDVRPVSYHCDLLNGLAFKPEDWGASGLPIIRIQNLNGGGEFNRCSRPVPAAYVIEPGTLLFSWSGNRGTSFGPYVWSGPTGLLNQHIFKVTPSPRTNSDWLYYALDDVRIRAERAAHGGSGLVHVRRGDLQAYEVLTPSPDEQAGIVEMLGPHMEYVKRQRQELSKLRTLKHGLMDDLLTGRVRVSVPKAAAA